MHCLDGFVCVRVWVVCIYICVCVCVCHSPGFRSVSRVTHSDLFFIHCPLVTASLSLSLSLSLLQLLIIQWKYASLPLSESKYNSFTFIHLGVGEFIDPVTRRVEVSEHWSSKKYLRSCSMLESFFFTISCSATGGRKKNILPLLNSFSPVA